MSATITVLVHRVAGHKPGSVVVVDTDDEGTPLEQWWRRRLRDAKRDGCCEVVTPASVPEEVEEIFAEEEPES